MFSKVWPPHTEFLTLPDRWLKTNTVKRRTHSLFRQGVMLYGHIPNWPDERLRPLLEQFEELLLEQRVFRNVFGII